MNWFINLLKKLFAKKEVKQLTEQTRVTLTIASQYNQKAFEFNVTNPQCDPKDVFLEFEKWYQDGTGSERYMLNADSFRSVVSRRHIMGYMVSVQKFMA